MTKPATRQAAIKRVVRLLLLTIALFVFGATAYYTGVVVHARNYTVETVLPNTRNAHFALALSDLSPHQIEILLKVEDPAFFLHCGMDFSTPGAGMTTITQSLVKHLYFEKFSPGVAKIKQTAIAVFALNSLMPKDEQLRLFINTANLGQEVNGFAQAANTYFNKPFNALTEDEYIAIVAMLIAPEVFSVRSHPERNRERVKSIKRVVSGEYVPKGLRDLYYGKLENEIRQQLPPSSYVESYYQ